MRLSVFASCCAALLGASNGAAQERISAELFLDRVTGKTATFVMYNTGALVGTEQFVRRNRTVWARADGSCAYGTVFVREGAVCFAYDDEPAGVTHCWAPFETEDRLLVVTLDGREIQEVTALSDAPVICSAPPTS